MRLSKAWIVASKEFKTFSRHKNVIYTILYFEALVSIGMPFLIRFITTKPAAVQVIPILMNAFSFWFVIAATVLPLGIAAYSLVGEKVQKSLEPLLATPTTDEEILVGKALAAFLPAIGANFLGALVFTTLVDLFTHKLLNYYYYPNWDLVLILFALAPLACLLSVGYNVLISSRSTDVRSAQQLGALIVLPLAAVYVLTETQALTLDTQTLLIIGGIIAVLDIVVFFLVKSTFRREEILTRWK